MLEKCLLCGNQAHLSAGVWNSSYGIVPFHTWRGKIFSGRDLYKTRGELNTSFIYQLQTIKNMATETLEREKQDLKTKISNFNPERKEGPVAKAIESQTSKLPSDLFLWASIGAMATSLTFKLMGKNHTALFIGQWTAPFLLLGIYNKIVKVEGHD